MKPMRIIAMLAALVVALFVLETRAVAQSKFIKTVESTAALLALNPNDVHNVAITSYGTVAETADDGSIYRFYPLSVAATNGTTVLKPTSFSGRWIRINGPGTGAGGGGTNGTPSFVNGTNTVTGLNLTNTATITWVNAGVSNGAASIVLNSVGGAQLTIDATAESEIEAVVDIQDLQGAATDAQVPNTITIDLATLATTAASGDSASAFFTTGTLENARLDTDLQALGDNSALGLWAVTGAGTGSARTITNGVGVLVDVGGGVTGNPSVRHNIEAGSNITLATNGTALVITASSGATGDNISFNSTNTSDANFTNSATISWIHNSATTPDDITANIIASSITAAMIANGDHGDFTYAAGVATIDANAIALTTDTTGNYVADVAGTAGEITSTHTPAEGSTATISLPAVIDIGGKTSFEIPNAAAPTVDAFGEIAGDNNAWAASRGAAAFFDGTSTTWLIGVLASDTPSNGQVPTFNTGGTITWETTAGTGDITGVGDVASGEAFNGTQGTTLTFNDTQGDHTLLFNTTLDQFEFSTNVVGAHFTSTNGFSSLGAGTGSLILGNTGVTLVDDGDGALVITGAGTGSDEDLNLNLDDTANNWVFSSSTGVTNSGFTAIGLTAISFTGPLIGNADTATLATTATTANAGDSATAFFASGTLEDARLSANVALLNASQTFSGVNALTNLGNTISGNGAGLTNLTTANLVGAVTDAQVPNTITIDLATVATTATVTDGSDATSFPIFVDTITGNLSLRTDPAYQFDASSLTLAVSTLTATNLTLLGTGTLTDLDAIAGTTEATLEAALDIGGDVTGTGLSAVVIADNAVDGTDIALGSDTTGDVMYYNGTDWIRLGVGANGTVLKLAGGVPTWGTDDTAGAPVWNTIGDASADGSVAFGGTTQDITGNTDDVTAIAQDVFRITLTNDGATDVLTQRVLVVRNASATGGTTETLLDLENNDNSTVTTGLSIEGTSTGAITTAIDVSDAEIVTALAVGANDVSGTSWSVSGAGAGAFATLTEGGNAVFNSTETPGGELGGTWASPTLDDTVTVSGWTLNGISTIAEGKFADGTSAAPTMHFTSELDTGFYWSNTATLGVTIQGGAAVYTFSDSALAPNTTGTLDLGGAGTRWKVLYATNANFTGQVTNSTVGANNVWVNNSQSAAQGVAVTGAGNIMRTRVGVVRSMAIPMGAWFTNGISGSLAIQTNLTGGSGDTWSFADAVTNTARVLIPLPVTWDAGVVKFQFEMGSTGNNTTSTNAVYSLRGGSITSNAGDVATPTWGTAITFTNHISAVSNRLVMCVTGDLTIGNTPAINKQVLFELTRATANAVDVNTNNVQVAGSQLFYTETATEPSMPTTTQ